MPIPETPAMEEEFPLFRIDVTYLGGTKTRTLVGRSLGPFTLTPKNGGTPETNISIEVPDPNNPRYGLLITETWDVTEFCIVVPPDMYGNVPMSKRARPDIVVQSLEKIW